MTTTKKNKNLSLTNIIEEGFVDRFLDFIVKWNSNKVYSDPRFQAMKKNSKELAIINKKIEELEPKIRELKKYLDGDGPYGENLDYLNDYVKKNY